MSLKKLKLIRDPSTDNWIRRIFILRPDNLGDVILFTGALRQIRKKFPDAEIVLCAKNYVHNLLELSPNIDKIISWEKMIKGLPESVPEFRGKWRLDALLRKFRILRITGWKYRSDIYLLPVRSLLPVHHEVTALSRADIKLSIGGDTNNMNLDEDQSFNHLYTTRYFVDESTDVQHELDTYVDFLKLLGIDVKKDDIWPEITTEHADKEWAEQMIPKQPYEIILAIAPGVTSISDKFYAAGNYRKALQGLGDERISALIFGSKSEIEQCKAVEDALANCNQVQSIQNFTGETTIRQLAEVLKRCDILLSNETGVLHMATALKVPTIGILGGGHYGRFYPWGDPEFNLKVNKPMDCYHCNWNCIYPTIRCIHEIKPEQITDRLQVLIDKVRIEKKTKIIL